MQKLLLIVCLLLILCACSKPVEKTPHYDISGRYLGLTTAELVEIKGAPGSVAVLPTGESVWTYKALMTVEPGAMMAVSQWMETISFIIDSGGRVKSYTTAVEQ